MFAAAVLLSVAAWAGFNVLVDPFGSFETEPFRWDDYSQTLSPRNAKAIYVTEHFEEFDSYILGSSVASSYLPEALEQYTDGTYYNLFHYGADLSYDRDLAAWLLENDEVKHIILIVGMSDLTEEEPDRSRLVKKSYYGISGENRLSYYSDYLFVSVGYGMEKLRSLKTDTYLPQKFDVVTAEDGVYDKRVRDVESIGELEQYLSLYSEDFAADGDDLIYAERCVQRISEIKALCDDAGCALTVLLTPVYNISRYDANKLSSFYEQLSQVTDYWNFQSTALTEDERYFYDENHARNALCNMVLSRIYGGELWTPLDFGYYCEQGSYVEPEKPQENEDNDITVPVLLYHHIDDTQDESSTVLHSDTFARQMALLAENDYTPVSVESLISYVYSGTELPENPVLITFDDGYTSNYEYAYPLLKQYGFPATIFVIGCSVGHAQYYKDTQYELISHFGADEINDMLSSGLVSIQSHSYDMHQWPPFEDGDTVRSTMLPLEGEEEEDYANAIQADAAKQNALFAEYGLNYPIALAFPAGKYTVLTDVALRACGIKATFTTDAAHINTLIKGLPQSLIDLGRMNISGDTTDEQLLSYLQRSGD